MDQLRIVAQLGQQLHPVALSKFGPPISLNLSLFAKMLNVQELASKEPTASEKDPFQGVFVKVCSPQQQWSNEELVRQWKSLNNHKNKNQR